MAGSSFDDAIKISFEGDRFRKTFSGSVSGSNPNVFYRFDVSSDRSRFSDLGVILRGLDDNADLVLFNSRRRVVTFSSNPGDRSEVIGRSAATLNPLRPGTYFLQVKRVEGATDFDLTISLVPLNSNNPDLRPPRPRPTETFSPATLARARRVNIIGRTRIIDDAVGGGNTQDFYRIDLRRFSRVSFFLRDLEANADMDLVNSQGQILRRSFNQGTRQETISVGFNGRNPNITLAPGTYYVRVYRRGSRTPYELNMTAIETTRQAPVNRGATAQLVANVNPGANSSNPTDLVVFNGRLYFTANDGISGRELWSTDGTQNGTRLLLNINPGSASSDPTDLFVFNNRLYFAANNGINGTELWRTDGTVAGTELVRDINPGAASSSPFDFVNYNGQLYFAATDALGRELWRTDGASDVTTAVTQRVADINPTGSSNPADLTVVGNTLFFAADDGLLGNELWSYDGQAANLVRNINPTGSSNPFDLVNFNNTLYFSADDGGILGRELYQSTGTAASTRLFVNLRAGSESSSPSELERVGNFFYFVADDGIRGRELYRSDGTVNGTTLVSDINPGSSGSSPTDLLSVNDSVLYFSALTSTAGRQLFRSGGTVQNTIQVTTSASPNLNPADLVVFNGFIYFAGTTTASGTEIFRVQAPAGSAT
ncbi:pre-peptidase C-terminal domain-containing protein [Oscillatoria sp. FACHB-1407]|uniref:ELWxxDGT repeat protein n=1 Tax=Oscillatoria sp. FACHB-1407 TaxID=2692847 RepID=UPI0016823DFD|nr:ELWxxDGT repeat protein [Oscillatoria sp. FACHB-1407]MBD2462746.1 pre-peptidase C-terminal domain-containing protein [Oscillatoria sp. FACHB-1407]